MPYWSAGAGTSILSGAGQAASSNAVSPALMAGANASGGLFRGMWDQIFARRTQQRTLEANKELAQYQYNQDLEQWNRANQYNSPTQQMARLKEAGLNPNLVYGKGLSAAGNTATALPKYNSPTANFHQPPLTTGIGSMLGQYQDFQIKQAQTNLLNEQVNETREQSYGRTLSNQLAELMNGIKLGIAGQNLKGKTADARLKGLKAGFETRQHAKQFYDKLAGFELSKTQYDADKAQAAYNKMHQDAIAMTMQNEWFRNTGLKGSDAIVKMLGMLGGGLMFRGLGKIGRRGFTKGPAMKKLTYKQSYLRPHEIKSNYLMNKNAGYGFFK